TFPPISGRGTLWLATHRRPRSVPAPTRARTHSPRPAPSRGPVLTALGIAVLAIGALTHVAVVLAGALFTVVCMFAFALEHHRNPAHAHQDGDLGVDHRKVAVWVFLGSECFFFGTLIATYLAYNGRSVVGPEPH